MDQAKRRHGSVSDWFRSARVRCGPEPFAQERSAAPLFAVDLLPHCAHATVQSLGSSALERLLRAALGRYLHGTSVLEVCVVNPVAAQLAHGPALFDAPPATRIEALELYTDEGYHAVLASALLDHLDYDEASLAPPAFLARLAGLSSSLDPALVRFLFVVITETSLSSNLLNLSRNTAVHPTLRAFADEHARDEVRHAALFSRLFGLYRERCSAQERAAADELLPSLVRAYLSPDLASVRGELRSVGLSESECDRVLAESYPPSVVRAGLHAAAKPALNCFRRAGAPPLDPEVLWKDSPSPEEV